LEGETSDSVSQRRYFHPPRNPLVVGLLPCRLADQVAPAVIRPRTIQQLKPHQYSDSYQMSEMIGQYNGVDTVQICETHDFANESFLLEQYESLTINERPDIANLAREWSFIGEILPPDTGEQMRVNAVDSKFDRDTIAQCCEVATFMTFEDSMKLNTLNKQQKARVMLVLEHDEWVEKHVNVPWPPFLVTVHPYTTHG
jgi:hypothetical protein